MLEEIDNGKIQLPDFQRGWVWDDARIRALIASLINSYPIGAVMFLDYGNANVRFQCRVIEGAPPVTTQPEKLILDGQQRLTAIYAAMFNKNPVKTKNERGKEIECCYYIDIAKALDSNVEMLDAIISVPKEKYGIPSSGGRAIVDLRTPDKEYQQKKFPLNISFDVSASTNWQTAYFMHHNFDPVIVAEYVKFQSEIINKLKQYQVPVISMERETPAEAICQVFENVNTGGVSLTVFELLTATFAIDNFHLREDWEKRRSQYFSGEILSVFTSTDFLGACLLLTAYKRGGTINYKRKEVLKLTLNDYKNCADILTAGFVEAGKFLQEEKIFSSRDLPYTTQIIPLAVLCTLLSEKKLFHISGIRAKLQQWYWCGVFGELYSGIHESRSASDVTDVMKWICDGGDLPRTVKDCYFAPMRLISLQSRNSAAYKGFMALILQNHAQDFLSGRDMSVIANYSDEKIDIHHIFPQQYCKDRNIDKTRYNSVINKTPLSSKTNRIIGDGAPSIYIAKIAAENGVDVEDLRKTLESHWVSIQNLRENQFEEFLANRAGYLLNAVEKATGKKILGRDTDEVKNFFGRAI